MASKEAECANLEGRVGKWFSGAGDRMGGRKNRYNNGKKNNQDEELNNDGHGIDI